MSRNTESFRSLGLDIDPKKLPTPIYIVDERLIEKNLKVLKYTQNARVLLDLRASLLSLQTLMKLPPVWIKIRPNWRLLQVRPFISAG